MGHVHNGTARGAGIAYAAASMVESNNGEERFARIENLIEQLQRETAEHKRLTPTAAVASARILKRSANSARQPTLAPTAGLLPRRQNSVLIQHSRFV
jgi:hypothetical protein